MIRFVENNTDIDGVLVIEKKIIGDHRGYLERAFCCSELKGWGKKPVVQVNRTYTSKKGTMRGFHFQYPPFSESKFICCLRGAVMDVALDIRRNSDTFGQCFVIELDAAKHNAVIIPEGVAHGFQTLTDDVEMLYFHSNFYSAENEAGLNMFDAELPFKWELACSQVSERDKGFPKLSSIEGIIL